MRARYKILSFLTSVALAGATGAVLVTLLAYFYFAPTLPDVETFRDVKLQVPLRIFTRDGDLIAEFGDKRRIPVRYEELPEQVVQAFIAAEDDRYFEHPGVDYQGLVRAALRVVASGGQRTQGGSTITMQLARNIFLTPDKTYKRKIQEIFLSLRMEREFSKQEILALYLNKIFLGQRAYGVGAAAEVYFGKALSELSLGEAAIIAGLPQSPSLDNPVRSPERARQRRAYVLRRMKELGFIDAEAHDAAAAEPVIAALHGPTVAVQAPYVAEMVRAEVEELYGREAINEGYRVVTSLDSRHQSAAVAALRRALHDYDRRHGYRGRIGLVEDFDTLTPEALQDALADYPRIAELVPAVVTESDEEAATLLTYRGEAADLDLARLEWAKWHVDDETVGGPVEAVDKVLPAGDVVYLLREDDTWQLAQLPNVQGAFVAVDPQDGAVTALSGGYDFFPFKFNRATQARRQAGSSFKPFVYSAALEYGLTPASIFNDAPVVIVDPGLEDTWRPKNYSGRTFGETRLREALVKSRNLVSIRVLNHIGIGFAIEHVRHFGFDEEEALPRDLSLALGSAAVSPLRMASAYSIFANGGYEVAPYFIDRIENAAGEVLFASNPLMVCHGCSDAERIAAAEDAVPDLDSLSDEDLLACETDELVLPSAAAPRVVSAQNAWLMNSMLKEVVIRGTGARARELGRGDLAGKTGTTNDHRDAWFSGYNQSLVATAWMGFDQERSLGRGEAGGTAALPAWMYFMADVLPGMEERQLPDPGGLVTVRISRKDGLLASAGTPDAMFETFRVGNVPEQQLTDFDVGDDPSEFDDESIF